MIMECFNNNGHAVIYTDVAKEALSVNDTSTSLIQNVWWF